MQRKFDKFYKTSMLIMVAIIVWLLWRCCGGIGGSNTDTNQNTIVYIPVYAPFDNPDHIPLNKPMPCSTQDIQRFKAQGNVGTLPCNNAPTGHYQFETPPGTGTYNLPNELTKPVEVSAPVTLYLFAGAIATIIVLRLFRK